MTYDIDKIKALYWGDKHLLVSKDELSTLLHQINDTHPEINIIWKDPKRLTDDEIASDVNGFFEDFADAARNYDNKIGFSIIYDNQVMISKPYIVASTGVNLSEL